MVKIVHIQCMVDGGLKMNWIKCTEQLPPKDIKVLCCYSDQYMDIMEYWYDDEKGKPEFWNPPNPPINNVTHWMPLPEAPKELF